MFKELNPLLHPELRLAVMSILIGVESADFVFIRQQTGATAGNLSVQLDKLAKANYIEIEKTFRGKMPCTVCRTGRRTACRRSGLKGPRCYCIQPTWRIHRRYCARQEAVHCRRFSARVAEAVRFATAAAHYMSLRRDGGWTSAGAAAAGLKKM